MNVDLTIIERTRDELDALKQRFEHEIVAAIEDERVVDVARAAGLSRPHVYRVLHKHGVEVDSEMGRRLVAKRWSAERAVRKIGPQPSAELDRYIGERRDLRLAEQGIDPNQPELFDPPIDGEDEPEMSIIEFAERMMARRNR